MKKFLLIILVVCFGCSQNHYADMVLMNGTIYTVNDNNEVINAVALKEGKIWQVGSDNDAKSWIGDSTKVIDLKGKYVYPGLIDGHAHLLEIGELLENVDLRQTKSFDEVVQLVKERADQTPTGNWILGSGWHQDKWVSQQLEHRVKGFPTHHLLSEMVPNHPVVINHASGHALLANELAMQRLQITKDTPSPEGGEIFKDVSGQPTGIFNETAYLQVLAKIPKDNEEKINQKLRKAIQFCLENGLTGFHEATTSRVMLDQLQLLGAENALKMRIHTMLDAMDSVLINEYFEKGPEKYLFDDHLNINAVKLYSDGALGSRGAWLLDEYSDAASVHGHNVMPMAKIRSIVMKATQVGFQACTHAIGDRANREVLDIYEEATETAPESDLRLRIEHAQHIHPDDLPRFAELGVIPAMQAIHMSSDRPWAIDRLGRERIESGAYMWRTLIDGGSVIVNGTDAPVEPVNPFANIYASISRKTLDGTPEGGYEPAQKMTREEALRSYTIWAAYGAFMEEKVGSIEVGKLADFTIIDRDIMTIPEQEILDTKVVMTIIGGEVVYQSVNNP